MTHSKESDLSTGLPSDYLALLSYFGTSMESVTCFQVEDVVVKPELEPDLSC